MNRVKNVIICASAAFLLMNSQAFAYEKNDAEFLENLTYLKGRVEAARGLIKAGKSDLALKRHLGDNLNARIAKLEPELEARKIDGFVPALDSLVANAAGTEAFDAAADKAMAIFTAAENTIPNEKLASATFLSGVVSKVVAHSLEDYQAAVVDGKVKVIKEYEEVYGYNAMTVTLWQNRLKPVLKGEVIQVLDGQMTQLAKVAPAAIAPDNNPVSSAVFSEINDALGAELKKIR